MTHTRLGRAASERSSFSWVSRVMEHSGNYTGTSPSIPVSLVFWSAFAPILKIVVIVCLGALCIHRKIIEDSVITSLGKIVFTVSLPSFVFVELGAQLSASALSKAWVISVFYVVHFFLGLGCGEAISRWIAKGNRKYRSFILTASSIGNAGTLPLVLVDTVCSADASILECNRTESLLYVLVFMVLAIVGLWGIMFGYMQQQLAVPGEDGSTSPLYSRLFTPPVIAVVVSIVVAVSPLQTILFDSDGYFSPIVSALEIVSHSMIPLSLFVLGGNIYKAMQFPSVSQQPQKIPSDIELEPLREVPDEEDRELPTQLIGQDVKFEMLNDSRGTPHPWKLCAALATVRLVLLPMIGLVLVLVGRNYIPQLASKQLALVLLVEYTMPTAINLSLITRLVSYGESIAAKIIVSQYPLTSVLLTMWMMVYVSLL